MRDQKKARPQQRNLGALVSLDKDALKRVVGGFTFIGGVTVTDPTGGLPVDDDPMGGGPGSGGHPRLR